MKIEITALKRNNRKRREGKGKRALPDACVEKRSRHGASDVLTLKQRKKNERANAVWIKLLYLDVLTAEEKLVHFLRCTNTTHAKRPMMFPWAEYSQTKYLAG